MIRRRKQFHQQSRVFKPRANDHIRVPQVQVIDQNGQQLGIMDTYKALGLARETSLDLVEVSPTNNPPVVKITDYGKFLYEREKRERSAKKSLSASNEIKTVRITFRASDHDLGIRANQADKFFAKGHKVRIELKLRGREKAMFDNAKNKMEAFLKMVKTPHVVEGGIKRSLTGITTLLLPKN